MGGKRPGKEGLPISDSIERFVQLHPDAVSIIALYLLGAETDFGEDACCEVAENAEQASAFVVEYRRQGMKQVDENIFGNHDGPLGIFMVFKKKTKETAESLERM